MPAKVRTWLGLVLVAGGAGLPLMVAISTAQEEVTTPKRPAYGLPNLAMHEITDVAVAPWYDAEGNRVEGRWAIRFTSVVDNLGRGHMIVRGHRDSVGQPCVEFDTAENRCEAGDMSADQVVINKDGSEKLYRDVGSVYFDANHNHWHLRAAERYQIQSLSGRRLTADVKTGFCFGDRLYYTKNRPRNYPGLRNDLAHCAPGRAEPEADGRRALTVQEGISSGWSDDYPSYESDGFPLEGQQLDITKLKAGRYRLINIVNPKGEYRETTRKDNAASVLFRLSWPGNARPSIEIVATCIRTTRCTPQRRLRR